VIIFKNKAMLLQERERKCMERLTLNVKEVAIILGLSLPSTYALLYMKKNGIPHIRAGKRVLVVASHLEAWLEEQAAKQKR
jgi:excisionase family DNA binding protein